MQIANRVYYYNNTGNKAFPPRHPNVEPLTAAVVPTIRSPDRTMGYNSVCDGFVERITVKCRSVWACIQHHSRRDPATHTLIKDKLAKQGQISISKIIVFR